MDTRTSHVWHEDRVEALENENATLRASRRKSGIHVTEPEPVTMPPPITVPTASKTSEHLENKLAELKERTDQMRKESGIKKAAKPVRPVKGTVPQKTMKPTQQMPPQMKNTNQKEEASNKNKDSNSK